MKHISVTQLNFTKLNQQDEIQLIDVREAYELEICRLEDAIHIPLSDIPDNIDKISKDAKVVFYCRSGMRSAKAIEWIEENYPFDNLYNLEGGILAWSDEIDPNMVKY